MQRTACIVFLAMSRGECNDKFLVELLGSGVGIEGVFLEPERRGSEDGRSSACPSMSISSSLLYRTMK